MFDRVSGVAVAVPLLVLAGTSAAQVALYGVDFSGNFYTINTATGAATLVGPTGFNRLNGAASNSIGEVYAVRLHDSSIANDTDKIIRINPLTGAGTLVVNFSAGVQDLRSIAFGIGDVLFATRDVSQLDSLVTVDLGSGAVTLIGPTGRSDIQGLTSNDHGALFACGITAPGTVFAINATTGIATVIGGTLGTEGQTMEWASGTTAWVARANLLTVDLVTGATATVGPLGISDLRGLAALRPLACYPNCDGSTASPVLNVADFTCFLQKFAAGSSYANCDGSTAAPTLNVADFTCFLQNYAAGCS